MDQFERHVALVANRLVQVCRDCASTLETAADVAESSVAREHYRRRATLWRQFCRALETTAQELGGAPPRSPGAAGALQRAWIKIKSAIGDADAIAAECAKREQQALRRCAEAANAELPPHVRGMVERFAERLTQQQGQEAAGHWPASDADQHVPGA